LYICCLINCKRGFVFHFFFYYSAFRLGLSRFVPVVLQVLIIPPPENRTVYICSALFRRDKVRIGDFPCLFKNNRYCKYEIVLSRPAARGMICRFDKSSGSVSDFRNFVGREDLLFVKMACLKSRSRCVDLTLDVQERGPKRNKFRESSHA